MTAFEWKTFFVWRVTYICVHVTQAQFLPTSSKHVSPGMRFLGLGIGGLSHQSCMSLHIGTNNIVGGSKIFVKLQRLFKVWWPAGGGTEYGTAQHGARLLCDKMWIMNMDQENQLCHTHWHQIQHMAFAWPAELGPKGICCSCSKTFLT